ncbi:hypothetical protein yc1106_09259 [Curvularia clavata]|uniref:Heterokaryon incompatibility domain-containing protein n=1 Tax=Curvularia clavata TaxID=95742 RepID=A0A9Q9DXI5_CURCL|nr:hypothetical protein yc1106_09259 [Curvularia clavata]
MNQLRDRDRDSSDTLDPLFPLECECDTSSASWQSSFELILKSQTTASFSLQFIFEVVENSTGSFTNYKPAPSTFSGSACNLIEYWLKDCIQHHPRCNAPPAERWAPTRLLDIGIFYDDLVKLVDGKDAFLSKQKYATLSHCWGGIHGPFFRTLLGNIKQFQEGIHCDQFPETLRDAIKVARQFHLRYLWIDSLCIIQDDIEDISMEVALMEKVYRYSFLNIAATGAHDSTKGCFWERDPCAILPTEISIGWSNHRGSKAKYRVVPEPNIWARKLTDEPLNRRAWVLQERILSSRVLHFGHEQLFWECRESSACETFHLGLPNALCGHPLIDIKRLQLGDEVKDDRWPAKYIPEAPRGKTFLKRLQSAFTRILQPVVVQEVTLYTNTASALAFRDWDAVVELYTMASLSFTRDKLIALSGIASSLSTTHPGASADGYLAGLWQSSLPIYLLWIPETSNNPKIMFSDRRSLCPERYQEYVAPTWSWASINGRISFRLCQHNFDPNDHLAVLEEASVSHQTSFRFGSVNSGFIKLSSPVATILWSTEDTPPPSKPRTGRITHIFPHHLNRSDSVSVAPDSNTDAEIFFDTAMDKLPDQVTLLPIVGVTKRTIHENETVIGLVLEQLTRMKDHWSTVLLVSLLAAALQSIIVVLGRRKSRASSSDRNLEGSGMDHEGLPIKRRKDSSQNVEFDVSKSKEKVEVAELEGKDHSEERNRDRNRRVSPEQNQNDHLESLKQETLEPSLLPIHPWIAPPQRLPGPYDAPYYPLPLPTIAIQETAEDDTSSQTSEHATTSDDRPEELETIVYSRRLPTPNASETESVREGVVTVSTRGWRRTLWTVNAG